MADHLAPVPVRRVETWADTVITNSWPATLPSVRQVLTDGLDLTQATVLVGENGTGKSTLVEGIAMAFGLNAEGGSTGAIHHSWTSESALHESLRLIRGPGASRWGYFVRAETLHGTFTFLDGTRDEGPTRDPEFHRLSHGEGFTSLLGTRRFSGPGFYVLDEPEAGLSFTAQLRLLDNLLILLADPGAQVLVATHSPIIAALPGARILELDEDGMHVRAWADLDLVAHHRAFCAAPERYLRHLGN